MVKALELVRSFPDTEILKNIPKYLIVSDFARDFSLTLTSAGT